MDTRIVFRFVTIGRYGKWYQTIKLRDAAVHGNNGVHYQASP